MRASVSLLCLLTWLAASTLLTGCQSRVSVQGDGTEHGQAVGFKLPF